MSIEFYRDKVGFDLDHDTKNEHMHVVQLTPRGSGCSIVFGDLPSQREMAPGSIRGLQLVVADAKAARQELVDRGIEASEIMEFSPDDGGTFFGFSDPDGNTWAVQQLKVRGEKPLIRLEDRGRFGRPDESESAASEVGEDRQDAAVILGGRLEAELAEDDPDVALDRLLRQAELIGDRERSSGPRPSARGRSRSRGVSSSSGPGGRPRPRSVATTSGSTTEPPAPTRSSASRNSARLPTRSLSR